MWPRITIAADRGGIAAGRDVIQGIPPEQLPAIIAAATDPLKQLTDAQQASIADLEHRLGASEAQVLMFFRIIGETDVPLEQVGDRLVEIAERYRNLLVEVARTPGDDPVVARLKTEAHAALEAGDFDRADALLDEVKNAVLDHAALEAAAVRAQRGDMALTRLRYRDAADHFAAAAARVPPGHEEQRLTYLNAQATAIYRQGDEFGDNGALAAAIERYRNLLALFPRNRVPLQWAMTQMNLGTALRTLGERESGTTRLEEAVEAYRAALEEVTRERVPLDWAMTQMNLGTALFRLGERESGTTRLEEAVEAYRAALEEVTRERVPLQWAMTQMNLGTALSSLGERESGTTRLEEAVEAYRAALEERTRERVPLDWAMTQMNLGLALAGLGILTGDRAKLEEAREAVSDAFAVFMQAGQEHRRSVLEELLIAIDAALAETAEAAPP